MLIERQFTNLITKKAKYIAYYVLLFPYLLFTIIFWGKYIEQLLHTGYVL